MPPLKGADTADEVLFDVIAVALVWVYVGESGGSRGWLAFAIFLTAAFVVAWGREIWLSRRGAR